MLRKIRFFLTLLVSIAFICFAVLNRSFVHISLFPLPYTAEMPLFIFAVLCFAFGVLAGGAFVKSKMFKLQRLLKYEHKHVMALQNEINGLQTESGHSAAIRQDGAQNLTRSSATASQSTG